MNTETSNTTDSKFVAITRLIRKEMKRLQVPGVAIGIYHKGNEYAAGFGVTRVEHPLPVTVDTLFQTGSISKTFTGTVIMMLVEQGRVDLDAPVKKYIKDFKVKDKKTTEKVTVRQLLTHMGGWIGDYFNDFGNGDPRLVYLRRVLYDSALDFVDLHAYPGYDLNMQQHAENVDILGYNRKPLVMGEFGADRHIYPDAIARPHQASIMAGRIL